MVVWVYAGGGDAEAEGIIPFLRTHLRKCTFELRSPKRKPGPRPNKPIYLGHTGRSLASEIRTDIQDYWDGTADAVLVIDDTDELVGGDEHRARVALLHTAVTEAVTASAVGSGDGVSPNVIIGLAVPEIEIWLLADWNNTFATRFKHCARAVKRELTKRGVSFDNPENYSVHDENGTYINKISDTIKEVIFLLCQHPLTGAGIRYSKATDTPDLLGRIDPEVVSRKCRNFKRFWSELTKLCGDRKGARS